MNTVSDHDPIVTASAPNMIAGLFGCFKEIEFRSARETFLGIDHSFMSKTYQMAMEEHASLFKIKYGDMY